MLRALEVSIRCDHHAVLVGVPLRMNSSRAYRAFSADKQPEVPHEGESHQVVSLLAVLGRLV